MDQEPRDVRLPIMVSRSEASAIEEYRFDHRISTRADAIRRLIEVGLKAESGSRSSRAKQETSTAVKPSNVKPGQRWRGPHPEGGALCEVEVANVLGASVECVPRSPQKHFVLLADVMIRSPKWVFVNGTG